MRPQRVVWLLLLGGGIMLILWTIAYLLQMPLHLRPVQKTAAANAPVTQQQLPAKDLTGRRYWSDPSMDPAVLKKAFALPPANLPPESLPLQPALLPSKRELKRLRHETAVVE